MRGLWKHRDLAVPLAVLCLLLLAKPGEPERTGDRNRQVDALGSSQAPDFGRQGRDRANPEEVVLYGGVQFKPATLESKELQEPARLKTDDSPFVGRLSPGSGSPDLIVPVGGEDEPGEPARLESTDADDVVEPSFNKPLSAIIVEGNETVATAEILKLVGMRVGEIPNRKQIRADVRALVAKHWFDAVFTRIISSEAGAALVFKVVEKPSPQDVLNAADSPVLDIKADFKNLTEPLADVVIEGNRAVSSTTILALMETRSGHIPDRHRVERDVESLYSQGLVFRKHRP